MSDVLDVPPSDLVFLHSPLHLLAMFTRFLQIRFSQGQLPWQWREDPNLVTSADGTALVYIDAEFALEKEYENASPALIVTRGSIVHTRPVVGDQAPINADKLNKGWDRHYGQCEMDIRIECVGQTKAEASILGDIVQSAITMSRGPLTKAMTLRDISSVVLSPTQPYIRDSTKWQNNVDFRVFFEQRWVVVPAAPVLDRVDFFAQDVLNLAGYVKTFALKNQ